MMAFTPLPLLAEELLAVVDVKASASAILSPALSCRVSLTHSPSESSRAWEAGRSRKGVSVGVSVGGRRGRRFPMEIKLPVDPSSPRITGKRKSSLSVHFSFPGQPIVGYISEQRVESETTFFSSDYSLSFSQRERSPRCGVSWTAYWVAERWKRNSGHTGAQSKRWETIPQG